MTYEQFDLVAVPFPFTNRTATKRRPALIVSAGTFNHTHGHSILAMVTTAAGMWPSDVMIGNWEDAGLRVPCKVRWKLFTLDNNLVSGSIGRLSPADRDAVAQGLFHALALEDPSESEC